MKSWKDKLLEQFIPDLDPRVWVVADPDGIVRNESVMSQLAGKGFDVVIFEDPVAFRYDYESRIRRAWERGERHTLVVLFEPDHQGFNRLPSDLLQRSHRLEFGLDTLFPNLDAGVLRDVPPELWEPVSRQAARHHGKVFMAGETEELVLRTSYKLVPDLIDSEVELLRRLIELHRLRLNLPVRLCRRVAADLSVIDVFKGWPVQMLLQDSKLFWEFIQERWVRFLYKQKALSGTPPTLKIAGPEHIAFDHQTLRLYVDNLFDEGWLQPVGCGDTARLADAWWKLGIAHAKASAGFDPVRIQKMKEELPETQASYKDWIQFGLKYSRLVSDLFSSGNSEATDAFWRDLWPAVDAAFSGWVAVSYPSLHNLPPSPPVMVHHIPKQLARWQKEGHKVALIVLDGLSCAGWFAVKDHLQGREPAGRFVFDESASFAWIPSLTPVSRQALYAGLPPRLFPETIERTNKDAQRWAEFWEANAALLPKQVRHQLLTGAAGDLNQLPDFAEESVLAYGITISMPDELMHGGKLGWRGLQKDIGLWIENGFLFGLLNRLLEAGFRVCLSADHGNLESIGIGKVQDGVLAERRGERIRVYSDEGLRNNALARIGAGGSAWDSPLMPDGKFCLLASQRNAFVLAGENVISHGGASLDELLVPWVTIKRKI